MAHRRSRIRFIPTLPPDDGVTPRAVCSRGLLRAHDRVAVLEEEWRGERLGEDVGSIVASGNPLHLDHVELAQLANVRLTHAGGSAWRRRG